MEQLRNFWTLRSSIFDSEKPSIESVSMPEPVFDVRKMLVDELFPRIFVYLDFPSCASISRVCKWFNELNNLPELWAERARFVKFNCKSLMEMGSLPGENELNALFRELSQTPVEDSRLSCRILMTCVIIQQSATVLPKLRGQLFDSLPGRIRPHRIFKGIKEAVVAVEPGGWIFLTLGDHESKEPITISKSVNFLGPVLNSSENPLARKSLSCRFVCSLHPSELKSAISFNNITLEGQGYYWDESLDLVVKESWSVWNSLPNWLGESSTSIVEREVGGERSEICFRGCEIRYNYQIVLETDRIDISMKKCTWSANGTESGLTSNIREPYLPRICPFTSENCSFSGLFDEQLFCFCYDECFRLLDISLDSSLDFNDSTIRSPSRLLKLLSTMVDSLASQNLREKIRSYDFPALVDKSFSILPLLFRQSRKKRVENQDSRKGPDVEHFVASLFRLLSQMIRKQPYENFDAISQQILRTSLIRRSMHYVSFGSDVIIQSLFDFLQAFVGSLFYVYSTKNSDMTTGENGTTPMDDANAGVLDRYFDVVRENSTDSGFDIDDAIDFLTNVIWVTSAPDFSPHCGLFAASYRKLVQDQRFTKAAAELASAFARHAYPQVKGNYVEEGILEWMLSFQSSDRYLSNLTSYSLSWMLKEKSACTALYHIALRDYVDKCGTALASSKLTSLPSMRLDELSFAKTLRCLSAQREIDSIFWTALEATFRNTMDANVFRICCDTVICALTHSRAYSDPSLDPLFSFDDSCPLIATARKLINESKKHIEMNAGEFNWISTIEFLITPRNFSDPFFNLGRDCDYIGIAAFKPPSIYKVVVSVDGRSVKCNFSIPTITAMLSHPVKRGKWYLECRLSTESFSILLGWATQHLQPNGIVNTLGYREVSWSFDLSRNYFRHGTARKCEENLALSVGGIIQLYLDCDTKVMAFGYNGKYLGVAFEGFAIDDVGLYPAFTLDADNEVRFNLRAEDMKFEPDESWIGCQPYAMAATQ